jgi:Zn-dependent peptidase ImmA (M78 family)/DNA-binding XRE family transcriptional regulator
MEKAQTVNPQRIAWCSMAEGLSVEDLAHEVHIAPDTLNRVMQGEDALSIKQLRNIAKHFNRGMLFFLDPTPVDEARLHSPQFRTISNQKPALPARLSALIERMEQQREVYMGLLEDLSEDASRPWYPDELRLDTLTIKQAAKATRDWLGLGDDNDNDLGSMRRAVEARNILVFISNGYAGRWQIPKKDPVRGFSLYFPSYPVVAIKKQATEGPQAFTLMHELAHLLLHRQSFIDDETDFFSYRGKEKDANAFAGNLLVPDRFLDHLDLNQFAVTDLTSYDGFFKPHCKRWVVSTEVILRRLFDEGRLAGDRYQAYRNWKQSLPAPATGTGGSRYRYKEPLRIFGEPFVRTVLDALHGKQITLARASTYLDGLKISDLHRLEQRL